MVARFTPHVRWVLWLVFALVLAACQIGEPPQGTGSTENLSSTPGASPTIPPPADLLAQALAQRAIGNDDAAAQQLSLVLAAYPAVPEARPARYYFAESLARRGHWSEAIDAFQVFLAASRQDDLSAPALFWLARAYEADGKAAEAAASYADYRALKTPLEPYAAIRQAAQQQALGQLAEAAENYTAAARADLPPSERALRYEQALALRRQLGQNDVALALYEELLGLATRPDYRARLLAEAAALAQQNGQQDKARGWLLELSTGGTFGAPALSAVDQLLAANDPGLSPSVAATIYFRAERYAEALAQFDAALAQSQDDASAVEWQRLRGLSLRGLGRFPEALDALAAAATTSPDSEAGRQARLDWIQTVGQSGETQRAIDEYRAYADAYATDPRAPEALDRAAQLLDRLGNADEAIQTRLDLARRYPQSEQAVEVLDVAALALFRAGRYGESEAAWQQLADIREGDVRARGAFWAARAARRQQDEASLSRVRALFERARAAAPDSYYGVRAAEELGLEAEPTLPLAAPMTEDDWRTLEDWVAAWSGQPLVRVGDAGVLLELRDSGVVQRAPALEQVGLQAESITEWNFARERWAQGPTQLLHLARLAYEQKVPYSALKSAEQLARLAPPTAPPAPEALRRLLFPAPYSALVTAEAQGRDLDPRLFYALLRQESLFNPGATSWVGARGLAQVMPTTGEGIAADIGVSPFHPDDLYRPAVSVRFGAFYLSRRINDMEGSIQGGLSAYNGGLGNAQRWAGGSVVDDADLFIESIDYAETREYVKLVYGYYGVYRQLYAWN